MRRFRRLLLWLPLVALTLFFAACGWHNWHIFMEDEEMRNEDVIIAASNYTLSHVPQDATVYVKWEDPLASTRIQNSIRQHHPRIQVLSPEESFPQQETFIDAVELAEVGRYSAGCYVSWKSWPTVGVRLTRSPFKFWDNSWHVTGAVKQEGDVRELP